MYMHNIFLTKISMPAPRLELNIFQTTETISLNEFNQANNSPYQNTTLVLIQPN